MSGVVAPWVVAVALVTYRSVAGKTSNNPPLKGAPMPVEYVASTAVFATLGVIDHLGPNASRMAALLGWGFDAAIFLNLFSRPKAGVGAGFALGSQAAQTQQNLDANLGARPSAA